MGVFFRSLFDARASKWRRTSEMNCTLTLSADNEDELLEAAVQHAITVHGHEDTPDLRTMIRTAMRDGTPPVEASRRAA
jgi:predicted small metal-binding protein